MTDRPRRRPKRKQPLPPSPPPSFHLALIPPPDHSYISTLFDDALSQILRRVFIPTRSGCLFGLVNKRWYHLLSKIPGFCDFLAESLLLRLHSKSPEVVRETVNSEYIKWLVERWDTPMVDRVLMGMCSVACTCGWLDVLRCLLGTRRVNPAANGQLLLVLASNHGHVECVKTLLEDSRVNDNNLTAMHSALEAGGGNMEIIKILLSSPKCPKMPTGIAYNLFKNAFYRRLPERHILFLLLLPFFPPKILEEVIPLAYTGANSQEAADLSRVVCTLPTTSLPSARFTVLLEEVALSGFTEATEVLLADGRAVPCPQLLERVAREGHGGVLRVLLKDRRVDPAANQSAVLLRAVVGGSTEVVGVLLEDGRADPGVAGALRRAVECGHCEIVSLLLEDGRVDPAEDNNFLLRLVRDNYNESIAQLLETDERVLRKKGEMEERKKNGTEFFYFGPRRNDTETESNNNKNSPTGGVLGTQLTVSGNQTRHMGFWSSKEGERVGLSFTMVDNPVKSSPSSNEDWGSRRFDTFGLTDLSLETQSGGEIGDFNFSVGMTPISNPNQKGRRKK